MLNSIGYGPVCHRLFSLGYDLIGQAETGSGKTAAFMLPIIQYVMKNKPEKADVASPYAIVIGSTRELVIQLCDQGRKLAYETNVSVAKTYGQYQIKANLEELYEGCDILCATVGRLKSFVAKGDVGL